MSQKYRHYKAIKQEREHIYLCVKKKTGKNKEMNGKQQKVVVIVFYVFGKKIYGLIVHCEWNVFVNVQQSVCNNNNATAKMNEINEFELYS